MWLGSPTIMRCQSACNLHRKIREVKNKQNELVQIDKYLKKRLEKLSKANANDKMTKKEMATVAKIKGARKKITLCEKTCRKHKKILQKRTKSCKRTKCKMPQKEQATLRSMFNNFLQNDKNINKLAKINRGDFMAAFRGVLLQYCFPGMRNDAQGLQRHKQRYWYKAAGDCYLMSLRKTPHLWLYHRWPEMYPHYLNTRAQWKNFKFFLMVCLGFLFWIPCLVCLEVCKCCFCACCCDN